MHEADVTVLPDPTLWNAKNPLAPSSLAVMANRSLTAW